MIFSFMIANVPGVVEPRKLLERRNRLFIVPFGGNAKSLSGLARVLALSTALQN